MISRRLLLKSSLAFPLLSAVPHSAAAKEDNQLRTWCIYVHRTHGHNRSVWKPTSCLPTLTMGEEKNVVSKWDTLPIAEPIAYRCYVHARTEEEALNKVGPSIAQSLADHYANDPYIRSVREGYTDSSQKFMSFSVVLPQKGQNGQPREEVMTLYVFDLLGHLVTKTQYKR